MSSDDKQPGPTTSATPSTEEAAAASAAPPAAPRKGKRRRTRSLNSSSHSPSPGRGFLVPGFDNGEGSGGGAMMMSLTDVMDAAKGITNMYLAHEIAVNKDFMLQDLKQPESPMEKQVKDVVRRAFWDLLSEQLKEDPPNLAQALVLLRDVKEGLLGLLVPQQKRLIDSINEKLDLDLISQQAENGALDFHGYATYVVTLISQLCAPIRDDEVARLRTLSDVVPLFQGILETLDLMKLDLANFHIQQARPLIVSQSVEYERAKFKDFLKTQEDGLMFTREWLKRHAPPEEDSQDPRYHKLQINRVIQDSFLELLEWDEYHPMPETLAMDAKRILAIRDQTERTSVSTAVILLTFSNISGFVVPMDAQRLKETIKKHTDVLLEEFDDDTDLLKILPCVAAQVVKDVNDYLSEKEKPALPESTVKNLEEQIAEMEDPNHRIRDLVQRRILEFNKQAITAARTAPLQVPPGLTLCQRELAQIAGNFVRLVNYNRSVFGEFYNELVENHVLFKTPAELDSSGGKNREA